MIDLLSLAAGVVTALAVTSVAIVAIYLITVSRKVRGKHRRRWH